MGVHRRRARDSRRRRRAQARAERRCAASDRERQRLKKTLSNVLEDARRMSGRVFSRSTVLERAGMSVVLLDDDVVAYVPNDAEHAKKLSRERRVLARIAPRLSFAVPAPIGPIEAPLDLRTAVRGRVDGPADVAWMTRALSEIHGSLSSIELDAFGLELPVFPGAMRAEFEARMRARNPREDVLCHGDFGTHNIVYEDGPRGVIDFHDIVRAPRWFDFRLMPSCPADLSEDDVLFARAAADLQATEWATARPR